jgi:hypothetical protein
VILQQVVIPILQWILGAPSQGPAGPSHQGFSGHLQNFIIAVCYVRDHFLLYIELSDTTKSTASFVNLGFLNVRSRYLFGGRMFSFSRPIPA